MQLPTTRTAAGATIVCAQSEILAINNTQFLVLARDAGFGHTYPIATSTYRKILIYDLTGATNIAGGGLRAPEESQHQPAGVHEGDQRRHGRAFPHCREPAAAEHPGHDRADERRGDDEQQMGAWRKAVHGVR